MRDNLIHELIHVILLQNPSINKRWRKYDASIRAKYPDSSPTTITHVAIHAIHLLVAQKVTPRRILHIKTYSMMADYIRAWSIVEEMGADTIIKLLFGPANRG